MSGDPVTKRKVL